MFVPILGRYKQAQEMGTIHYLYFSQGKWLKCTAMITIVGVLIAELATGDATLRDAQSLHCCEKNNTDQPSHTSK